MLISLAVEKKWNIYNTVQMIYSSNNCNVKYYLKETYYVLSFFSVPVTFYSGSL